ncbi:hypothetical protein IMZ48_09350, partial [Candidatus Bathyarchaeota archaeon]|nr:hypothetical protein [Candidatus Bathyarchaeota archaeon]
MKLRSLVSQQLYATELTYFVTYTVGFALSAAAFVAEWFWPRNDERYQALDEDECPLETATIFSRLTFSWMTPLMQFGYKQYLKEEDLWPLAHTDTTKTTGDAFGRAWAYELEHRAKPSLWIAMFRAYGGPYSVAAIYKVGNDIAQYVQPQLLRVLIAWVQTYDKSYDGEPEPVVKGAAIALAMFATAIVQTAMVHQYFQITFVVGMRIKAGLASAIYKKSLKLSNEGRKTKTTGDIVNYM